MTFPEVTPTFPDRLKGYFASPKSITISSKARLFSGQDEKPSVKGTKTNARRERSNLFQVNGRRFSCCAQFLCPTAFPDTISILDLDRLHRMELETFYPPLRSLASVFGVSVLLCLCSFTSNHITKEERQSIAWL